MSNYISCANTAKLIRKEFKTAFPGQKFSVRSKTYSMGASITIDWRDGPTIKEVEEITGKYEGARFDGMIDLKTYKTAYIAPDGTVSPGHAPGTHDTRGSLSTIDNPMPEGAREVKFGSDYVNCSRSHSPEFIESVRVAMLEKYPNNTPPPVRTQEYPEGVQSAYFEIDLNDPWQQEYRKAARNTSAYVNKIGGVKLCQKREAYGVETLKAMTSHKIEFDRDWTWVYFPKNPGKAVTTALGELGAKFSKKRQGWYFTCVMEEAKILQALETAPEINPPLVEKAKPAGNPKTAATMRKTADNMTAAIKDKFADHLENTYRRQQIAQGQRDEGYKLQKTQIVMNKLADMWEAGTIPAGWEHLKSKKAVYETVLYRDMPQHQELNDLADVKIDHKAEKLRKLENEAKLMRLPGYFPTPENVIGQMLGHVHIEEGTKALEPSAGSGNIADQMRERGAAVDICETSGHLREILELKGYKLNGYDFLEHDTTGYEVIMMNPPFEKSQDIFHVMHAYDLLENGGQLVSIMSEGPFFREDKNAREFRLWLDDVGGWSEKLPAGSFKESGTGTSARMVIIEK